MFGLFPPRGFNEHCSRIEIAGSLSVIDWSVRSDLDFVQIWKHAMLDEWNHPFDQPTQSIIIAIRMWLQVDPNHDSPLIRVSSHSNPVPVRIDNSYRLIESSNQWTNCNSPLQDHWHWWWLLQFNESTRITLHIFGNENNFSEATHLPYDSSYFKHVS